MQNVKFIEVFPKQGNGKTYAIFFDNTKLLRLKSTSIILLKAGKILMLKIEINYFYKALL